MKFGVGQSPKRSEDLALLQGRGSYSDDAPAPNAAFGFVLRSPFAHGELTSIDASTARDGPGVLAVLTRDELEEDEVGDIQCLTQIKNRDGEDHGRAPWPILARDRVRYVGQPIAFVIAETLAQAKDAAEQIEFDVEDIAAEVDTKGATRPGAEQIHPSAPGNEIFDFADGDEAAVNEAFASAARVTKATLVNNRIVCNAMEPRSVSASPDGERFLIHANSQGPAFQLGQLAGMLKIAPENLRIITGNVGGGFGTKAFLYPETCLTLWAAKRLGRAVRWTGQRTEIFLSDVHGRDNVTEAELAMDAEGRFLAVRATTYAAMGAYLSNFGPMIPTEAAVGMYTGVYRIPKCFVNVKGIVTNTVPVDAYRGAGRPEAAFIIERLVDIAARELSMAPDALRRLNMPAPAEMPHTMGLGAV
ncbi:MAG: molybdopterin cofactor-binding domain-containing protein, partial [Pseudomonadota bacterium]